MICPQREAINVMQSVCRTNAGGFGTMAGDDGSASPSSSASPRAPGAAGSSTSALSISPLVLSLATVSSAGAPKRQGENVPCTCAAPAAASWAPHI